MDFKRSKIYGIIGTSGAGKSVFCEHLNGLYRSKSANIYFSSGEKILFFHSKLKNYRKIRSEIGMVFQFPEYQLFKETVLQDIIYGPKMLFNLSKNELKVWEEKAKNILKELDFPMELLSSSPLKLSGGQKRKVTLAGVLIFEPKILVFDEPTLGLDPQSVIKLLPLFQDLRLKGLTLIIVSSNMDFIFQCTDEILFLESGELKQREDTYSFFRRCPASITRPKIINFIDNLISYNRLFEEIWKYQPKDISELSTSIISVFKGIRG